MNRLLGIINLVILPLIVMSATAHAGLLRLESNTLSSLRNGEDLKTEVPFYEYLEASYGSTNRDFEMNANFSYFVDPMRSGSSTFNLYVLDATYRVIPRILKLKVGRTFNIETAIRTVMADQVAAEFSLFRDIVKVSGFYGQERTRELDTFKNRARIAGGYLSVRSSSATPLIFNTKFQQRDYEGNTKPLERLVSASVTKTWDSPWTPEFMVNSEYNISDKHNRLTEGGFDLNPTSQLGLRLRGLYYYVKGDEGLEQPIYSIFAVGPLYEGLAQVDYKFTPDFVAGIAFAYTNFELGFGAGRANGQKATISARYQKAWLSASNALYGFRSYGGNAYGNLLKLEEKVSDRFAFYQNGEITHYDKITSSNRWAYSSQAGVEWWFTNPLKFTFGGELNSNNILRYDARLIAKLTYTLWTEI